MNNTLYVLLLCRYLGIHKFDCGISKETIMKGFHFYNYDKGCCLQLQVTNRYSYSNQLMNFCDIFVHIFFNAVNGIRRKQENLKFYWFFIVYGFNKTLIAYSPEMVQNNMLKALFSNVSVLSANVTNVDMLFHGECHIMCLLFSKIVEVHLNWHKTWRYVY